MSAGGEIRLVDARVEANGSAIGQVIFAGSPCGAAMTFLGRVTANTANLTMTIGRCGLIQVSLQRGADGWSGSYTSQWEIPQLGERKGKDQRSRRIVQYVDPSLEGLLGSKLTAKMINKEEQDTKHGLTGLAPNPPLIPPCSDRVFLVRGFGSWRGRGWMGRSR